MSPTFGILHDFRRPLLDLEPMSSYYAQCLDEVALADDLGFDTVWMSEHHFTRDGLLPSRLVLAERIVAYRRRGVDLILAGFLHFQEEIEYFGAKVLPLVRELEAAAASQPELELVKTG